MAGSKGREAPPHRAAARHHGRQCGPAENRRSGTASREPSRERAAAAACSPPEPPAAGGPEAVGARAASMVTAGLRQCPRLTHAGAGAIACWAWHGHRHPRPAHRLPWHRSLPAAPALVSF